MHKESKYKTYLVTDTHFGHTEKMIETGRPDNYERLLLQRLCSVVNKHDVIIHLGDVALKRTKEWHDHFLNELKGCRRTLVVGNHDKHSIQWLLDRGWDFVCNYIGLKRFGLRVHISHKPTQILDNFDVNVHGHIHQKVRCDDDRYIALSAELLDYRPIELDTLLKIGSTPVYQNGHFIALKEAAKHASVAELVLEA